MLKREAAKEAKYKGKNGQKRRVLRYYVVEADVPELNGTLARMSEAPAPARVSVL